MQAPNFDRQIIDKFIWHQGCEIGEQAFGLYAPQHGDGPQYAIDTTLAVAVEGGDFTREQVEAWRNDPDFNDGAYTGLYLASKQRNRIAA